MTIRPLPFLVVLVALAVGFLGLNYAGHLIGAGEDRWRGEIWRLADLNDESGVGTWYSSLLLVVAGALSAYQMTSSDRSDQRRWAVLAAVFVFLSVDEATEIHETADALHDVLDIDTATTFLWTLPYSVALVALTVSMYPFLRRQPVRTQRLFVLSAIVYLGGGLGLELVAVAARELDWDRFVSIVLIPIEETLEMLGVSMFLYAHLDLVAQRADENSLRAGASEVPGHSGV